MNFAGLISLLLVLALLQPPEVAAPVQPPDAQDSAVSNAETTDEGEDGEEAGDDASRADFIITPAPSNAALAERDAAYQNRLLSAFRSAQGRQGPLDGRWTVADTAGSVLYVLQFADPGAGESRIEGAWRDPKRAGPKGSGFIDAVARDGEFTVVRFVATDPEQTMEVRLRPAEGGGWVGETVGRGGVQVVVMRRAAGVETAAFAAPQLAPEPVAPRPKAKARPTPKRGKAKKSRPRAAPKRAGAKKK